MDAFGGLYRAGRRRICEIVTRVGPDQLDMPVPACPQWTVHDVVAHLAGSCADALAGNLQGVTTAAWADAQVRERRDLTVGQLLEEWSTVAPPIEAAPELIPAGLGLIWVLDVTAHEHDLRGAVGEPGARDSPALLGATDFLVTEGLGRQVAGRGLGPLTVTTPTGSWLVGEGPADGAPSVSCSAFDLFRALTGRRSRAQISRFRWTVDPEPYLPAFEFGTFTTRPSDLDE